MVDYFTRRGERPLPINVGGIVTNPFTGLPYDYFQKDTTTPYPGWTSPRPSVGRFNVQVPVDEGVATYSSFAPPSRSVPAVPLRPSGEQAATEDQVNRDFRARQFGVYDDTDIVGGSFFSEGDPSRGPAIPGSGYLFSHPVLKGDAGMPFSGWGTSAGKGASVFPAVAAAVGSQIPGAGLLGLIASGLNSLGAYHRFNPAADANLFVDPETGLSTWGSISPGGGGSRAGSLNLYNMLQDYGSSYPNRQVQTPSKTIYHKDGSSSVVPQYANARDLAYIMRRGDRPPPGLYTQQTPVGYQDFGEGHNVTNQEALRSYAAGLGGAIMNEAGAILGPDAGYNATSDLAESMAENLQDQMDFAQSDIAPGYSGEDWGYW